MQIYALILANGKGTRYGMPKVDAVFNGLTFLQHIETTLAQAKVDDYLVIRDVETPDMLGSIRYGMHQIMTRGVWPGGWLIWPVDHPFIKAETITALIECHRANPKSVVIPQCHSTDGTPAFRRGHPIILPGGLIVPNVDYPNGLKSMLEKAKLSTCYISVDDPAILANINTPEDVHYV